MCACVYSDVCSITILRVPTADNLSTKKKKNHVSFIFNNSKYYYLL